VSTAVEQLDALLESAEDPFRTDEELLGLQLEAAQERFAYQRSRIPVLDQRARDTGVDAIKTLDDIIPLLFSHTTYKSYPASFVSKGRWDSMMTWLRTIASEPLEDVDVSDVGNIDEWIQRLWDTGNPVYTSTGTSGKISILPMTENDRTNIRRFITRLMGWPRPIEPKQDRRFYQLGPSAGPNRQIDHFKIISSLHGIPGAIFTLSDEPLLVSVIGKAAELRQRMMDNTATPAEIEAFELEAAQRTSAMSDNLRRLVEDIVEHRREPMMIYGFWSQHWEIFRRAREMGVPDGEFHPDTVIGAGGGTKGADLPADYADQIVNFYGQTRRHRGYSMTEMTQIFYQCDADRYHRPPGVIPLVLDATGERLLGREGQVEGRMAFLDVAVEGRWGGLITGDKVTVDFSSTCPCGRPGPTVLDTVARYKDLGDEDKITCAGSFDAYVRGMVTQ
jgi:hypothetical protein